MEISIISISLSAVLILGCLYLIISPFFKNEIKNSIPVLDLSSHENKLSLMTTLNEIEFEHKMKKISDEDYASLKKQYELLIADLLKNEEQMINKEIDNKVLNEVEAEIENELRRRQEEQGRK